MELQKSELIEKVESKGMTFKEVAEKIEIDPTILTLYFNKDDYPVPVRILKKVAEVVLN